jgi:hypothetical protein
MLQIISRGSYRITPGLGAGANSLAMLGLSMIIAFVEWVRRSSPFRLILFQVGRCVGQKPFESIAD